MTPSETALGSALGVDVVVSSDGHVRVEVQEGSTSPDLPDVKATIAYARVLAATIRDELRGRGRREAARVLGSRTIQALLMLEDASRPPQLPADWWSEIETLVSRQLRQRTRVSYVSWVVGTAAVLATVYMYTNLQFSYAGMGGHPNTKSVLFGALGGCLGVAVSVLQRSEDLALDWFNTRFAIALEAAFRAFLGSLMGALIAALVRAQLVLSITPPNEAGWDQYKLIVLGLGAVAGFSERLIPELLRSLERAIGGDSEAADARGDK